jgi:type II secretory pathway component PulK
MRTRAYKTRTYRSAMALVAALWVSVLMMALVSVAAQTSLLDSRVSQNENEKQRGRWACRAGIETAIALLLEDDRSYDGLTDLWSNNPLELENLDFGGATVTVKVIDASSKLNVNVATLEQLLFLPILPKTSPTAFWTGSTPMTLSAPAVLKAATT